jgi:hypothetical protein
MAGGEQVNGARSNEGGAGMEDFKKSLKAWLYDRTANPLFFTFLFSWCVWNYKLFIVAFTGNEPLQKLFLIELHLYREWWQAWCYMLVAPALTTAFMILVYPILSQWTAVVLKTYQNRYASRLLELDNKRPVDEGEVHLLRGELVAVQSHFSEMENSKNAEISDLRKTITTLQAQISPEKKIYPHQDLDDFDKLIVLHLKAYFDVKQRDVGKTQFEMELEKITKRTATQIDVALRKLQVAGLILLSGNETMGQRYGLTDEGKAYALTIDTGKGIVFPPATHEEEETMSQTESVRQFLSGMQVIEKAIIAELQAKSIFTDSQKNYLWHRGKEVVPIPTNIELKITLNDGTETEVTFAREWVEDCHSGIDRSEVRSIILGIVKTLSRI